VSERPDDVQLYEKIGYCHQLNNDYEEALRYYRLADVVEKKAWTLKKIGLCLRRLGKTEEALEYYLQASELEPDNIHTIIMTAHCYLDLKNYEAALKYYFKVEYNDPGNIKIMRPIAFCYFALGRFDDSEKYYDRLSESKLSAQDDINMGHLALCMGNKREAVALYRHSLLTGEITREQFMSILADDKPMLISLGVNPDDLPILLDYLLFLTD